MGNSRVATKNTVSPRSCGYTEASEGAICTHQHDGSCGYAEGMAGSPCTYVCKICPVQEMIDALPPMEETEVQDTEAWEQTRLRMGEARQFGRPGHTG